MLRSAGNEGLENHHVRLFWLLDLIRWMEEKRAICDEIFHFQNLVMDLMIYVPHEWSLTPV